MSVAVALDAIHAEKYRDTNQSREDHARKLAQNLSSHARHAALLEPMFLENRFLPAGRVQAAGGSSRTSSYFNCAVSGTIEDSMESIGQRLKEALLTLRLGTGIGYCFSNLRPEGALIKSLGSAASGPLSFMDVFDQAAGTIHISHRRGAQMAVLRVDHPDILKFIEAKRAKRFSVFNLSVGVTHEFMAAVRDNALFALRHNGVIYSQLPARDIWDAITLCAYETAEPGILFLDHINDNNNLHYCENIVATNPCAEQPLPPYGMCLLGSFNLTQYISNTVHGPDFDYEKLATDIPLVVEAYDNIFERSVYALPEHKKEAQSKRRMGLGMCGIANAIELIVGKPCYGDAVFNKHFKHIAEFFRNAVYNASVDLAMRRGPFEAFGPRYLDSRFIRTLPDAIIRRIETYGIRNSHLLSYAPTGTIALVHGNVSSGVEPVFYPYTKRRVLLAQGETTITIPDYNVDKHNLLGRTLASCSVGQHLGVHAIAQQYCDSAVSKTINLPETASFSEYKIVWQDAYALGIKGLTVYRPNEIRPPIITKGDCDSGECQISIAA